MARAWPALALAAVWLLAEALYAQAQETAPSGSLTAQFRSYYLDRSFERSGIQQSLALGGWLAYVSPSWRGLSLGLTGYTSQPAFFDDPERDGGGLLAAGQRGYSVLGVAYGQGSWGGFTLRAGRQIIETPMINSYDVKMTPVTLEGLSAEYRPGEKLAVTTAHLVGIKGWNETTFIPMSEAAGLGGDEPVSLAGAVWRPTPRLTLQAFEYLCHQFMNMVYAQADSRWDLSGGLTLTLSLQALHQRDIGEALGGGFTAGQAGLMGTLDWRGWSLSLGGTSTLIDHDIVNPWGSYPGFTSIMEEDNDRAGEDTLVLGLKYDFAQLGVKGLSATTYHTAGHTPDSGPHASPDQTEHDLTVDYIFPEGALKDVWIRARLAHVDQDEALGGQDFTDFRIIINFPLTIFK